MKAFASRIACGSFINCPIFLGVLLKRHAYWFVRATTLVPGLPLNNTGAVEADRVLVEFGAAAASCGPLFHARSSNDGHINHRPAITTRPITISNVKRERIKPVTI